MTASNVYRWGGNGRFFADCSGSIGVAPDLNDATISDFRKILDSFPYGVCLNIVGNLIREIRVLSIGDNPVEGIQDVGSEGHVTASDLGEFQQDLGQSEGCESTTGGGNLHDIPFVIAVLPRSVADSIFPVKGGSK